MSTNAIQIRKSILFSKAISCPRRVNVLEMLKVHPNVTLNKLSILIGTDKALLNNDLIVLSRVGLIKKYGRKYVVDRRKYGLI